MLRRGPAIILSISITGAACAAVPPVTGARSAGGAGPKSATMPTTATAGPTAAVAGPVEVARATLGPLAASKHRLGNGLTVVLMPDPSATSVSYMTWFRVGSRNEDEA